MGASYSHLGQLDLGSLVAGSVGSVMRQDDLRPGPLVMDALASAGPVMRQGDSNSVPHTSSAASLHSVAELSHAKSDPPQDSYPTNAGVAQLNLNQVSHSSDLSSLPPFPKHGLTLAGIMRFMDEAGGRDALMGMTTTEVCSLVKATTASSGGSYCSMLETQGSAYVGRATVFVSHAWSYKFLDVVDALVGWSEKPPPGETTPVFWFDVFTSSQHDCFKRPFEWWDRVFNTAVNEIGRTVLVLTWGDGKPNALTRAWCLVEIVASLGTGAKLDVIMAPHENAGFIDTLLKDHGSILHKLSLLDCEKANAYHGGECRNAKGECEKVASREIETCPDDLGCILRSIRAKGGIGFVEVNTRVIARMREWMVGVTAGAALQHGAVQSERVGDIIACTARLLWDLGRLDEAEARFREALEIHTACLDKAHSKTLTTKTYLGKLLTARDRLVEAEEILVAAHDMRLDSLGEDHADSLSSIMALAELRRSQGDLDTAVRLFRKTLEKRMLTSGAEHLDTVASMNGFASLLNDRDDVSGAEALYLQLLPVCRDLFGDGHPYTLSNMSNLAGLVARLGNRDEAREMYSSVLDAQTRVLGQDHPDTVTTLSNLSVVLGMMGEVDKAVGFARTALASRESSLGREHRDTLACMHNLAVVVARTQPEEASKLLREALDGRIRVHGEDHRDTLASRRALEALLNAQ